MLPLAAPHHLIKASVYGHVVLGCSFAYLDTMHERPGTNIDNRSRLRTAMRNTVICNCSAMKACAKLIEVQHDASLHVELGQEDASSTRSPFSHGQES
eukprot:scaffold168744_cov37-Tisochrysis_lutea.AAC.5